MDKSSPASCGRGPASAGPPALKYPVTPDGRYFVVRGRLWRMSDPALSDDRRAGLVRELMAARRAMGDARRAGDRVAGATAKAAVDRAKRALGELGPVWWDDGAPDFNRHLARTTPYAAWHAGLGGAEPDAPHPPISRGA